MADNPVMRQHGTKNFNKKWALTKDDFEFILECENHTEEILQELRTAIVKGLAECGLVAEGYAKRNITANNSIDTGRLRNSITFNVDENENSVSVGTNVEYGPYVELGTGKYYPGGRPTPWAYQDENGDWHWTAGNRAKPYLKPAVADHQQVYIRILNKACKGD